MKIICWRKDKYIELEDKIFFFIFLVIIVIKSVNTLTHSYILVQKPKKYGIVWWEIFLDTYDRWFVS